MEEAVCTGGNRLVAIDASRADDADRRLVRFHVVRLVVRRVRAQNHVLRHVVGAGLDEKRVLHVASGVVGGEVQHREHVQVVVDFRPLGQRESHALEDVDDFVLHDGERMARAQRNGVGRAREVDVLGLARGSRCLHLLLQRIDVVESLLFQLVELDAHGFLLVGSHVAEVRHQRVDFALAAQVFQTKLFNLLGAVGRQAADFLQQCFYFL